MAASSGTTRTIRDAGPIIRFGLFLVLFVALKGVSPGDLVVGAAAAAAATAASLRLMPGRTAAPVPSAALAFAGRFLWQSLAAGIDVARRAFDPKLPLATGLVTFRPSLARGTPRDLFTTVSAMMPGTLPAGDDGKDGLVIHCLDRHQPVAAAMAHDEARLRAVMAPDDVHKPAGRPGTSDRMQASKPHGRGKRAARGKPHG